MQKDDVRDLLLYASVLWPRTFVMPQDEDDLAITEVVWTEVLGGLDTELIRAAMVRWDDHWPPSPKELYGTAMIQMSLESGEPQPPSLDEAWIEFTGRYKNRGPWSHPAVESAARAIGCQKYGVSDERDEATWRAHFIKFYTAAVERQDRDAPLPPILASRMAGALRELDNAIGLPTSLDSGE